MIFEGSHGGRKYCFSFNDSSIFFVCFIPFKSATNMLLKQDTLDLKTLQTSVVVILHNPVS